LDRQKAEQDSDLKAVEAKQAELARKLAELQQALAAPTVMGTVAGRSTATAAATAKSDAELKALMAKKDALASTISGQKAAVAERVTKHLNSVDVCFLLDCTSSMSTFITKAKEQIVAIINKVMNDNAGITIRTAVVAYRDYDDKQRSEICEFSTNANAVKGFIAGLAAEGGGDVPEDMAVSTEPPPAAVLLPPAPGLCADRCACFAAVHSDGFGQCVEIGLDRQCPSVDPDHRRALS
jgi:hypothetical protein